MTTPEPFTPNSTMILVLGGCTLVTTIVLLILVGIGLRALVLGRDEVLVFSWRFPQELVNNAVLTAHSVQRIRELPALLNTLRPSDTPRPIPASGILRMLPELYLRLSFFLLRRKLKQPPPRRAIQRNHYQPIGVRNRARAGQHAT